MNLPPRPRPVDPQSRFLAALWDYVASLKPGIAPGVLTHHTTRGTFRIPFGKQGAGGSGGDPSQDNLTWL